MGNSGEIPPLLDRYVCDVAVVNARPHFFDRAGFYPRHSLMDMLARAID